MCAPVGVGAPCVVGLSVQRTGAAMTRLRMRSGTRCCGNCARNLTEAKPRVIICNTQMCKGIPFLEEREITHFVRVEASEWERAIAILDEKMPA